MSTNNSPVFELPETVCFDLDAESRKVKVDQFIEWIYHNYGDDMYQFFKFNYDGILENKLPKEYGGFNIGTRLSKVLMKKFGLEAEDVRQKLSMLIQSNKVTGKLCISVHPLDFLSASENNHSWRSCHALDGEYRVGNVSYMLDECTFMAYLKSDDEAQLPHFPEDVPWNDKKWRCYFYIDRFNQIVYAAKQYPFFSESALNYISEILKYKFGYFWTPQYKQRLIDAYTSSWFFDGDKSKIDWETYARINMYTPKFVPTGIRGETVINGHTWCFDSTKIICGYGTKCKIVPITNFIDTDKDACCYNDVIQSHSYAPWTLNFDNDCGDDIPPSVPQKLIVGKPVYCVCCGDNLVEDSDTFMCAACKPNKCICWRCGSVGDEDDMCYDERNEDWLCEYCWHDLYGES